jgi:hypothetical protein
MPKLLNFIYFKIAIKKQKLFVKPLMIICHVKKLGIGSFQLINKVGFIFGF